MGTRLLVIGGDGAGMAAASQVRRAAPDMEIVALEKGRWTSYSACGIPYLAGGALRTIDDLVVRTPDQFRADRIDVRTGHEALSLDLDARRVEVRNLTHQRTFQLGFDYLHLATGALPRRPDIEGVHLPHVHGVQTLDDAASLLEDAKRRRPARVAVIGSGYIGLEMAEAFKDRGAAVTVFEARQEVMATLDPDMARLVAKAMREAGIEVRTGVEVTAIDKAAVVTEAGEVPADLVVLGTGVVANSALAAEAGLAIGVKDSIVVDRQQRTSAEGVWSAGDCCQSINIISGAPTHQALGTVANKQGRVAGLNIAGRYTTFPGVLGTAVTSVCSTEIGRTGLGEDEAAAAGLQIAVATVESTNAAAYMPDSRPVMVKLIAEKGSGRLVGAQIVGGGGSAKRIDVIAAALAGRLTAEDLIGLDLSYAPPISPLWDPVQVAARALLPGL